MIVTPQFVSDLESEMKVLAEREYLDIAADLWWTKITKTGTMTSRRVLISWFMSTAGLDDMGVDGGNMKFDELAANYTEFEARFAGRGLKVKKSQFEDTDGGGINACTEWQAEMAGLSALYPQTKIAKLIVDGENAANKSYDNVPYFSNAHPLNPFRAGAGTYANIFTGAAASTPTTDVNDAIYPGACPIDESVTLDVALANLGKVMAYIRQIRMANGETYRGLRPMQLQGGPRLQQRLIQLTNAKTIAQAAAAGGGSADVEAIIKSYQFVEPVISDELGALDNGLSWCVGCKQMSNSQLGAFVGRVREPFATRYYGTIDDAVLGRMNELEWQHEGRSVYGYGHPYLFFKVKST